jgi:hypothetical protein
MSVVLTSSSSQYLKTTTVPVSAKPVTFAAWVKTSDFASYQVPIALTKVTISFLILQLRLPEAGEPVAAGEYAGSWKLALSSTSVTSDTWHHVCGTFVSATERTVFLDGEGKVTNTDNQNVDLNSLDRILIGTHKEVAGNFFNGKIAQVSIWSTELSDAEIIELASGANPQDVQFDSLEVYWELDSDGTDKIGSNDLTAFNGATFDSSDNPTVGDLTVLGLSGNVDGVSTCSGALGTFTATYLGLAGSVSGQSSVSGAISKEIAPSAFPPVRPSVYDPDLVWDEDTQAWVSDEDLLRRDGSRHKTQLVVVGKDLIYFGAID